MGRVATAGVGDRFALNDGGFAVIVEYRGARDIDVKTNTGRSVSTCLSQVRKGNVRSERLPTTGDRFSLNCGSVAVIIEYRMAKDIDIKTNTGFEATVEAGQLRKGNVKDPYAPSAYGIGFLGYRHRVVGQASWSVWRGMIKRCYSDDSIIRTPAYSDCTVVDEWHDYSVFADWFDERSIAGYDLDKDLKVFGNRIYGPDTCTFVPVAINYFFKTMPKQSGLPHGIKGTNAGNFQSSISGKTLQTMEEARDNYWLEKRKRADTLCEKHPEFTALINNYFPQFKAANWDAK